MIRLAASALAVLALGYVSAPPTYATSPQAKRTTKPVVKRRATAAPIKKDPYEVLVQSLFNNRIDTPDENLASACGYSNAAGLMYALDDTVGDWDFSKDEFETTESFDARIAKMEASINTTSQIIICKKLADEKTFVKYDADKQVFTVDSYTLKNYNTFEKDTGSYVSSTAMGAKARVYAGIRIDYEIDLGKARSNLSASLGCGSASYEPLTFSVPAAEAQDLRVGGYVAMIGHLRQPFVTKNSRSGSPTLTDPFDTSVQTYSLQFDPTSIVLVSPGGKRIGCVGAKE